MVEISKSLIGDSYIVVVITWLFYMLKIAINYWNTTEIERKLMTDLKRLNGSFSKFVVSSLLIIIISFAYIIINQRNLPEMDFNSENTFLIIISITVIFVLGGLVINFLVFCLDKILTIKYDYFIKLSDSDIWKVIRMTDKKTLLIQKGNNESKLINDWIGKSLIRELNKDTWMYKLCGDYRKIKRIIYVILFLSVVVFILSFILESPSRLLSFLLSILGFLASIIIYGNYRIYRISTNNT